MRGKKSKITFPRFNTNQQIKITKGIGSHTHRRIVCEIKKGRKFSHENELNSHIY